MAIYTEDAILISMHLLAHNGIDHIHHAHKGAEHASEPNYLLLITVFVALVGGIAFALSRLSAKAQMEKTSSRRTKKER